MSSIPPSSIDDVLRQIQELAGHWQGSDLEHQHRDTKLWPIGAASGALLEAFITLNQPRSILELGTSGGYSTLFLARAAIRYGALVHTIEHDKQKVALAQHHFSLAGMQSAIKIFNGDIFAVLSANSLPQTFDFVFIDAEKARYGDYLETLLPRLNQGALVIADNVHSHRRQLEPFIQSVQSDIRFKSYLWPHEAGLLVAKFTGV